MSGKKFDQVFWGVIFVAAAVLLVLNQMGIGVFGLFGNISIWTILLTVLLGVCCVKSAAKRNTTGVVFSLAFLFILYKGFFSFFISVWTILLAAVLLSIGLSMIFHNSKKNFERKQYENFQSIDETVEDVVNFHTSFGSSIKYVNSGNFSRADLTCNFGAMKVYFDKAVIQNGTADIYMDVSFSGVELYVPRDWRVVSELNLSLAGLDEKNRSETTGVPVLRLGGNVSFGGVTIIYV